MIDVTSHVRRRDPDPLIGIAAHTLQRGLLVFDADARILAHNGYAEVLLDESGTLSLVPIVGASRPSTRLASPNAALQALIEQTVHDCASRRSPPVLDIDPQRATRTVPILQPPLGPGIVLHLTPLPVAGDSATVGAPAVVGELARLKRQSKLDLARLIELFDLSLASARVAEVYLRVDSVKDAARQLGISANTVKTHLATVYERTGCTRQSQLVRLLMSLSTDDRD